MHRYRIWIAHCQDWHPRGWHDLPPAGVAVEPAEEKSFTAEEAADFVRDFNLAKLATGGRFWAVAVPVCIRYEGDLSAGTHLVAPQLASFRAREGRRSG